MNHIRAQLCTFTRTPAQVEQEFGVAIVKAISFHDVITIIDYQGRKVKSVWNYSLIEHPLGSAIDSSLFYRVVDKPESPS